MRESGFTEVRWYHGQIVRPKLIFSYWLGAFFDSQNKEAKSSPHTEVFGFCFAKQGGLHEIRKISR